MKKLLTDTQILSKPITKGMVSAFGSPAISAKGAYERAVVFFRLLAGEQDWFSGYDRAMNDVFEMSDGDKVVEWIIKMYSSSPRIRNLVDSHPNRKQFLFLDRVRANPYVVKEGKAFVGKFDTRREALDEMRAVASRIYNFGAESLTDRFKRMASLKMRYVRKNPPFYAHNLYEKKTHGLNLKQMRRLYAMVSRGNRKAITYARNVLGIPFSESPSQVKAVVLHHVRDLAERKLGKMSFRKNEEYAERWLKRRLRGNPFRSGGYLRETPKEAGYRVISLKGRQLILEDLADGKRELWARSPNFAGYAIFYKNNTYEFVTSVLPGMTPVLPRAGQPILGNRKKQAIVIDIYDYTYEAGKGGGGLMMFHGGGREGSGYFKSRDQMEKMIGLLRRSFKISAIRDRRTWK